MTKIVDLVNFHTAYGEQVRLLDYFYNEDQNRAHITGYVPIRSHRNAFLRLAKAQLPDKENKDKVFMLTGSFGTGKSHLCLMLANYFSLKPTDLEMDEFFSNWAKRDKEGADTVRNWRGGGRYLVAPCDFAESRQFEDMVISAIERALEFEGAEEIMLNTHFKSALRLIAKWEERRREGEPSGVFEDFLAYLGGDDPQDSLESLKKSLDGNDSEAMKQFQELHEKATGQRLSFRTDNLLAILKDLLSSPEFQARYNGLVILADEFGYALDENRVSMSVFQGFAEMSKDGVDGMQLVFVGTGHRRFAAYGANPQLQIDFRVVQDRVTEVGLESEELEQIIAALVSPKTENPTWQEEVIDKNDWLLTKMASDTKKLKVFDYLSEPDLKEQIVTHIYPVHPLATYCLTKMSQELGSDARSVFSFFRTFGSAPPPPGSYAWFVNEHEVTKASGELNTYTPDLLVDYFGTNATTTTVTLRPEIRDNIRNYNAAVQEAQRFAHKNTLTGEVDPLTRRVLALIFVYRASNFNVTDETLTLGLNLVQTPEKKALTSELKSLLDKKIIFQSPSGQYEFRRTDMADIETLISATRSSILEQPLALAQQVGSLVDKRWDPFIEAKGHNQSYLGDKRLLRVWATPADLGSKQKLPDGSESSYWDELEQRRMTEKSWKERYEGIAVYALCENEAEIKQAQHAAKSNNKATIIVGIPRKPLPIREAVVNLLAVMKFKESEEYSKLDFAEKAIVDETLGKEAQQTGRIGEFLRARDRYLGATELYWYQDEGKTHLAEPGSDYAPADVLVNRLYSQHNTVAHEYLNKAHPKSFSGKKDSALREAVAKLIETERSVQIDHGEKENRGEIRYLKALLVKEGVLTQKGDYQGNLAEYELEDKPEKYQDKFPALAALLGRLKAVKRGESVNLTELLSIYTEPPFGQGPYALALFTGCVFRYFGDELRLKVNPTTYGYSPTNDPDIVIDVATGAFPMATIERRVITPAIEKLINSIYNMFADTPAPAGTQQTLSESWRSLVGWWKKRTRLERAVGIYGDDSTALALADMLSKSSDDSSASAAFLDELMRIYGHSPDAELGESEASRIVQELQTDKAAIESRAGSIKSALVNQLAALFNPAGETYKDYSEAITNWFKALNPEQKILNADWQTQASKTILEAVPKLQDLEVLLLETIPSGLGFKFGKVDDWSYDQSSSYRAQFEEAIETIAESLPKVPTPEWSTSVDPSLEYMGGQMIKFAGSVQLSVKVPDGGESVRIAINEDPQSSKQFTTVKRDEPWSADVTESSTYQLVTLGNSGEFSKVVILKFTNLDDGYKLIQETAPKLEPGERQYRFRNPVDKHGLSVLLKDIVGRLKQDNRIPASDIAAALREAAEEMSVNNE